MWDTRTNDSCMGVTDGECRLRKAGKKKERYAELMEISSRRQEKISVQPAQKVSKC